MLSASSIAFVFERTFDIPWVTKEFINFDRLRKSWRTSTTLGYLRFITNEQPTRTIDSYMYKTAVHNANLTFSGSLKRSLNILKPVPYKTTAQTLAKGRNAIASPNCCERIEETNYFEDLRSMRREMNREKSVLITYTSYWIESRYTNVVEALHKEAMKPNTSLSVFEIDSYHACSNATTHFAQTLTVLTFNLVSGGDFRRKPEIKTSPSPISTIHLFGVWGIE